MHKDAALDEIAQKIQRDAPDYFRAIMLAPIEARAGFLVIVGLDIELFQAVQSQEPLIGAMKLAWWAEKLADETDAPRAHPVLVALQDMPDLLPFATRMVDQRREDNDSFPEMIKALAYILSHDAAEYLELINIIGAGERPKATIAKVQRPIAAMILPKMTKFQFMRFAVFGRS